MHVNWSATVPFETLRVFVVGKNYRVQNIQLSKIRLAGLCRQSVNVGHRSERHSRPAFALTRFGGQAALKRSVPTSVQERPEGLITSPKLFQRAVVVRLRDDAIGLTRQKLSAPNSPPPRARASAWQLRLLLREVGGEYRSRTGDLLVANQALSQLS